MVDVQKLNEDITYFKVPYKDILKPCVSPMLVATFWHHLLVWIKLFSKVFFALQEFQCLIVFVLLLLIILSFLKFQKVLRILNF